MRIDEFALWAPGIETQDDWMQWYHGEKAIEDSKASPRLDFVSPLAVRRLSQLTKMTCHAFHLLYREDVEALYFSSVRGEISIQYDIDAAYARDHELKPATFAISVFNTAPAQATILCKTQIPYTPLYSGQENVIGNLWKVSTSSIRAGRMKKVMLVYAEERTPDEYRNNLDYSLLPPMYIALTVDAQEGEEPDEAALSSPQAFARYLLSSRRESWVTG